MTRFNPTVLGVFRLAYQEIPERGPEDLSSMGVPDHLIREISNRHSQARRRIAQTELKILYALIPKLRTWLKERVHKNVIRELSQWHAFVRRIDTLERELNTRGRGEALRAMLDKWRDRPPRPNKK